MTRVGLSSLVSLRLKKEFLLSPWCLQDNYHQNRKLIAMHKSLSHEMCSSSSCVQFMSSLPCFLSPTFSLGTSIHGQNPGWHPAWPIKVKKSGKEPQLESTSWSCSVKKKRPSLFAEQKILSLLLSPIDCYEMNNSMPMSSYSWLLYHLC